MDHNSDSEPNNVSLASRLSPLGFGAAPIGNLYRKVSGGDAEAAIQAAIQGGIRYFDTAPFYGFGLSEKRLGHSLAEARASHTEHRSVMVSTKVGRCLKPLPAPDENVRYGFASPEAFEPYFDYSYDGVMRSFETSLQRLGIEKVDVLFAHDLGEETHGSRNTEYLAQFYDGGYKAMCELREAGLVSALGIGVNECAACVGIMREVDLDCILLAGRYSLLDQSAAESVFPLCAEKNTSVILGGVFNSGVLATGVREQREHFYNYAPALPEIIERVKKIETLCLRHAVSLPAAALQFPFLNKQVACVLVGIANAIQATQALENHQQKIPLEFWQDLVRERLISGTINLHETIKEGAA